MSHNTGIFQNKNQQVSWKSQENKFCKYVLAQDIDEEKTNNDIIPGTASAGSPTTQFLKTSTSRARKSFFVAGFHK